MKKFGGIELGEVLGGFEIVSLPVNKLPQEVSSAVAVANSNPLLGATYNPIWYVGYQTVNGVNYLFIAEDIRTTKDKDKSIVGVIINVPAGEQAIQGAGAKVVRILDGEKLLPEVQTAFATVEKDLKGVSYKPILYMGKQPVRGENHYIVCESRVIYPSVLMPKAVIMAVNIFEGKATLAGLLPIKPTENEGQTLFGYAFNW